MSREIDALLQWALPRLGLRWQGFKNVRRQVCRRVASRIQELGLDVAAYRRRLEEDPDERRAFDALCFVTISRFYRDHRVFDALEHEFLPGLAAERRHLRAWSAGCASGEEPYTLAMLWKLRLAPRFPEGDLEIVATDFNAEVLARAERGTYEEGSLRELPPALLDPGFELQNGLFRVRDAFRTIHFERRDIRTWQPDGPLDLVLCRNSAFTYFDEASRIAFLERLIEHLNPGGVLVVGAQERIPPLAALVERAPHVYVLHSECVPRS
jgi:chemotaxis protein methyltransferase CheR